MTRQALYACLTCTVPRSPDFSPAGICLACSYNCHEGHELVSNRNSTSFLMKHSKFDYRVSHLLVDLGWVDFGFGDPPSCPAA